MAIPEVPGCFLVDLPTVVDFRGNLTFVQNDDSIPFQIRRIYYVYDIPTGAERGGHAHKDLRELIVPLMGSFDCVVDDGNARATYHLDQPSAGLFVPQMIWRDLTDFSSNAICLVLASELFEEQDYYREYSDFLRAVQES